MICFFLTPISSQGSGGFQDARAAKVGAEWYLENALELLDQPNEYYYSKESKLLYLCYNGTGPPKVRKMPTSASHSCILTGMHGPT